MQPCGPLSAVMWSGAPNVELAKVTAKRWTRALYAYATFTVTRIIDSCRVATAFIPNVLIGGYFRKMVDAHYVIREYKLLFCFYQMENRPTLYISDKATRKEVQSVLTKWHDRYDVPAYPYVLQEFIDRHFPAMWHEKMPCILSTDLKSIEIFEGAATVDNCSICWNPLKYAVTVECGHSFHRTCLRDWVVRQPGEKTCPLCRGKLTF